MCWGEGMPLHALRARRRGRLRLDVRPRQVMETDHTYDPKVPSMRRRFRRWGGPCIWFWMAVLAQVVSGMVSSDGHDSLV
jgi:hypothetical protein